MMSGKQKNTKIKIVLSKTNNKKKLIIIKQQIIRSQNSSGVVGNGESTNPVISASGEYILFTSTAINLDPNSGSIPAARLYLYTISTTQVQLVSNPTDTVISSYSFNLYQLANYFTYVTMDTNSTHNLYLQTINVGPLLLASSDPGLLGTPFYLNSSEADYSPLVSLYGDFVFYRNQGSLLLQCKRFIFFSPNK